ncbi:MAG: hypothetical protein AAF572_28055 [Cyanobacteria bacterium P01_B01_bin.77]
MERQEVYGVEPQTGTRVDFTAELGEWINFNPKSQGIQAFSLVKQDETLIIHVSRVGLGEDWGKTVLVPFFDNVGEKAFYAVYDRPHIKSYLTADLSRGLWSVVALHQIKDRSQPNFFTREFYYQDLSD